jgi:hypothetical protein
MSYDITIGDEWFNYTSNLGALFYDHAPDGLRGLDGLRGKDGAGTVILPCGNGVLHRLGNAREAMGKHIARAAISRTGAA